MRNQLHMLMKRRTSWNDAKPLSGSDVWVSDLVRWYGLNNRFNRGLKPWDGVEGGGDAQILPARIKSRM